MGLTDQLQNIRCVSEYEAREIDDATLGAIVTSAAWAPSAADSQPWEIIAVRDPQCKHALVETLLDSLLRLGTGGHKRRHWIVSAPLVLVVCLDHLRAQARYGDIGERVFGMQDTGAALQNMRLVALELGIQGCLVREFDHAALARQLELPRHVEPLILVAMGYSRSEPVPKHNLPLDDFLHLEKW